MMILSDPMFRGGIHPNVLLGMAALSSPDVQKGQHVTVQQCCVDGTRAEAAFVVTSLMKGIAC